VHAWRLTVPSLYLYGAMTRCRALPAPRTAQDGRRPHPRLSEQL